MIHKPTTGELGGLSDNFVLNKMPFHATQDINVYFMQHNVCIFKKDNMLKTGGIYD